MKTLLLVAVGICSAHSQELISIVIGQRYVLLVVASLEDACRQTWSRFCIELGSHLHLLLTIIENIEPDNLDLESVRIKKHDFPRLSEYRYRK